MEYFLELLKLIVILAIFIGVSYVVMKKMKKSRFQKHSANRLIQVIDGVQIGMKEEIALIKVGNEYILVSLSSGNMVPLKQTEIKPNQEDFADLLVSETTSKTWKDVSLSIKNKLVKK